MCLKAMLLWFVQQTHADHGYCDSCPFFVVWVFTSTAMLMPLNTHQKVAGGDMMASFTNTI
jgi:hypothetical protein